MKLALMALVIEICLVRLFVNSWGWSMLIVAIYCMFVYVRQTMLAKKQSKNNPSVGSDDSTVQSFTNYRRKAENKSLKLSHL